MSGVRTPLAPDLVSRLTFRWDDLPLVTAALPGTGGRIRAQPEDFTVVEIPRYLPEGRGSHLYLRVRKRNRTTRELVRVLVAAGLDEKEIGVAGLKDKHAVTEQWISIPNRRADAAEVLSEAEGVEILELSRHRNKLAVGHLLGNAFQIRIGGVDEGAAVRAEAILRELAVVGAPNYFGPQRFGRFARNAVDGYRLVRGERVPGGHRLKRFFVSALQSHLFNLLLARRIDRGLYASVVVGDWAKKHDTGGVFRVEDPDEAARARRLEISATLPLYGRKIRVSEGEAGSLEQQALDDLGLAWTDFRSRHGDRRITRMLLRGASVSSASGQVTLAFTLDKGAYATSILREVMKVPVDESQSP